MGAATVADANDPTRRATSASTKFLGGNRKAEGNGGQGGTGGPSGSPPDGADVRLVAKLVGSYSLNQIIVESLGGSEGVRGFPGRGGYGGAGKSCLSHRRGPGRPGKPGKDGPSVPYGKSGKVIVDLS